MEKKQFKTSSVNRVSHSLLTILIMCLLVSCRQGGKSIVILYENDVHCNLDGYARLRGLADRVADTAYVAVTSSGDYLHGGRAGAVSSGAYIIDIMKNMDYAAVGLGNHEFDHGMARLQDLMAKAGMPVVSHNLRTLHGDSLLFAPYIMREFGNTRIAFIGIVTPETLQSEAYSFFDTEGNQLYELWQDNVIADLQETIDRVRSDGADYVIVLSHLGEVSPKGFYTSPELIAATNGIDVVLDGHTHSVIPCDTILNNQGRPVLLTQTGTKFHNVGKLLITPDGHLSLELLPMDSITVENKRLREVVDSVEAEIGKVTSHLVCHSDHPLTMYDDKGRQQVRYAETNSGNIVSDAFRAVSGAQLAVNNGGGIRSALPAGDWTEGDILDMLPYHNFLQVVSIKGATLLELLHATTENSPREDGHFPQISGFRFTLDTAAVDEQRISNVEILDDKTGKYSPLDLHKDYTLCTTDYCVGGGGMYGVLSRARVIKNLNTLYSDALITYLRENLKGVVPAQYAGTQGRINLK